MLAFNHLLPLQSLTDADESSVRSFTKQFCANHEGDLASKEQHEERMRTLLWKLLRNFFFFEALEELRLWNEALPLVREIADFVRETPTAVLDAFPCFLRQTRTPQEAQRYELLFAQLQSQVRNGEGGERACAPASR